jgi:hypothetical protein
MSSNPAPPRAATRVPATIWQGGATHGDTLHCGAAFSLHVAYSLCAAPARAREVAPAILGVTEARGNCNRAHSNMGTAACHVNSPHELRAARAGVQGCRALRVRENARRCLRNCHSCTPAFGRMISSKAVYRGGRGGRRPREAGHVVQPSHHVLPRRGGCSPHPWVMRLL